MKLTNEDLDNIKSNNPEVNVSLRGSSTKDVIKDALDNRERYDGDTVDWHDLPNQNALTEFINDVMNGEPYIGVLVDVDADGYSSGALIFNYLYKLFKNSDLADWGVGYLLPEMKLHGLEANRKMIMKKQFMYDWIVTPDSSSNDTMIISELNKLGTKVLVIDHHIVENPELSLEQPDVYHIVNNQMPEEVINKNLTGAGMSYLVTEMWDNLTGNNYHEDGMDLMALGQIADMSDLNDNSIFEMVSNGMKHITNPLLKEFFKDDKEIMSVKHMQFSIIPQINAVSRVGEHDDRNNLFLALIGNRDTYLTKKRKKGLDGKFHIVEKYQTSAETAVDTLKSVKGKQDRQVKKALDEVDYLTTSNNSFSFAVLPHKYNNGITGLIANKELGNSHKPSFVVLRGANDSHKGSGRIPTDISNGKDIVDSLKHTWWARGHESAFGVMFKQNSVKDSLSELEQAFKDVKPEPITVDAVYQGELPSAESLKKMYEAEPMFRGAQDIISIAVLGLQVPKKDLIVKNNWTNIKMNGIRIDDFNTTEPMKEYYKKGFSDPVISFTATVGMNFWGEPMPQLVVDNIRMSKKYKTKVTVNNIIF